MTGLRMPAEVSAPPAPPAPAQIEQRILDRLVPEELAALTERLIRAASENPGDGEEGAVAVLAQALLDVGAHVQCTEVGPGRPNLLAWYGDQPGGVLFLGHSDVVPAGPGWSGDPFQPRREDGRIIGRGACDMKGGLAAVVCAMKAVHAEAPEVPVSLLCTVDEEVNAAGVRQYIATAPTGGYTACIAAEPTGLVAITACRGATNLRLEVHGASAHAGNPADGASAILAAAQVIAAVEEDGRRLQEHPHPLLGSATWNIGTIEGGHGTSIVPDRCVLSIDRRMLPGERADDILGALLQDAQTRIAEASLPGAERITVAGEVEMVMPGFCTPDNSDLARAAVTAVRDAGGAGGTGVWTAACEGGFLSEHHGIPAVVLGAGDIAGQAHQPDESVSLDELGIAARAYALLALRHCGAPRPSGDLPAAGEGGESR